MTRLLDRLRAHGENVAVLTDSQQLSYHQLTDTVTDGARELAGPRRLVLIETRNDLGTLVHYVAAMAAGHVVLPVAAGRDHTAILQTYEPDVVIDANGIQHRDQRGRHRLHVHENGLEKCVGCSLCAAACPADCIRVVPAENTAENRVSAGERYARIYEINLSRCIFCGYCELACPFDAITLGNEFEISEYNRDDLIYTKDMLLAPPMKRVPVADRDLYDTPIPYYKDNS